jgi:hypothetical protein
MATVNLDALIPREDFDIKDTGINPTLAQTIKISDLEKTSFFYNSLRKPDFQRETSDWSSEQNLEFIRTFIEGDLIPAIILWNAGRYTFVIDGAHRLSSLLSWVNDDYGDGFISQSYFEHKIDEDQIKLADKTRKLINSSIGAYKDYIESIQNQEKAKKEILERASRLGYLSIQLQWVTGDSQKAENSFFKINQQAVPIEETEMELLKSRHKPQAIAARAIIRAGTGHKYWERFHQTKQTEIESLAVEINESLFIPKIKTPIKTLDLPLAGKGYSSKTLSLVFDLIKLSNNIINLKISIGDDDKGDDTIQYLKNTRKIIRRICGNHPSSLGLHPAVYFYSDSGRYQQTPFLAIIELMKDYEKTNFFSKFTEVRKHVEIFLINNKFIINQFAYKHGSGLKGYLHVKRYFDILIQSFIEHENEMKIKEIILKEFPYITIEKEKQSGIVDKFSTETKSAIFIKESLENSLRCSICEGYIHQNAISFDHKQRKKDGGLNTVDNGQVTHPYCNSLKG